MNNDSKNSIPIIPVSDVPSRPLNLSLIHI